MRQEQGTVITEGEPRSLLKNLRWVPLWGGSRSWQPSMHAERSQDTEHLLFRQDQPVHGARKEDQSHEQDLAAYTALVRRLQLLVSVSNGHINSTRELLWCSWRPSQTSWSSPSAASLHLEPAPWSIVFCCEPLNPYPTNPLGMTAHGITSNMWLAVGHRCTQSTNTDASQACIVCMVRCQSLVRLASLLDKVLFNLSDWPQVPPYQSIHEHMQATPVWFPTFVAASAADLMQRRSQTCEPSWAAWPADHKLNQGQLAKFCVGVQGCDS